MSNKNNWWEILDPFFLSAVAIVIVLLLIGTPNNPSDYNLSSSDSLLVSAWQNYGTTGLIIFLILISVIVVVFVRFANKSSKS